MNQDALPDSQLAEIESIIRTKMPDAKPEEFIRRGVHRGRQRYLHKPTGRRFVANGALPGQRVPPEIVGETVSAYHDGLSYRDVQRQVERQHGFTPSTDSLYNWNISLTRKASELLEGQKAETGPTWVADEMVLDIDGEQVWLWNVMDGETRYLLATHLSKTRTRPDAEALFRKAKERAENTPKTIVTDGLLSYIDGIERVFGSDTQHRVSQGIHHDINNNLAERLHGTIRERNKVMRGLATRDSAALVMDGFRIHYNHFKPHMSLDGKTPGEVAGIDLKMKDWRDIAALQPQGIGELRDRTLAAKPPQADRRPAPMGKPFRLGGRRRFYARLLEGSGLL